MEKTTKKRKKSKRLKKRIGLLVVGGLSLVLTVCLSVGATLAWFAGSTWASNDLYMGGPVYVEMAGRGENSYTGGTDNETLDDAVWEGGAGTLDIIASGRSSGTAKKDTAGKDVDSTNILLPGQKLLIYSQARVFSTLTSTNVDDGKGPDASSGSDNSNVSDGTHSYYNGKGTRHTATTSVLRAKFSIDIQFDPTVGFNNFTDATYAAGYPVQSKNYVGEAGEEITADVAATTDPVKPAEYNWDKALGATAYSHTRTWDANHENEDGTKGAYVITSRDGRRDAVAQKKVDVKGDTVYENGVAKSGNSDDVDYWVEGETEAELTQIKNGYSKCIYKWKYVSKEIYFDTDETLRMGKPFNGTVNSAGGASNTDEDGEANTSGSGNGYYGIFVAASGTTTKQESDAFYKARTESYLTSYKEHYIDDYNRDLVLQIGSSLNKLEQSLNDSFVNLVNASSDKILTGNVMGFDVDTDGSITYDTAVAEADRDPATWLYVDPVVGNDTNDGDSSSSVGGWWYLVKSANTETVASGNNQVATILDNVTNPATGKWVTKVSTGATTDDNTTTGVDESKIPLGRVMYDFGNQTTSSKNVPTAGTSFTRSSTSTVGVSTETTLSDDDPRILNAELYEIVPDFTDQLVSTNPVNGKTTTKVVSVAFPFVNGNFELPGKELTNVFANARISFKITFQALQAFFPFANSIDGLASGSALAGTGKALNIGNAIPIYNEAFDYLSYLDTGDTIWP